MTQKSYPNIYREEYDKAVSQLTEAGAFIFNTDGDYFSFDLKIPGGRVKGDVGYVEPMMKVTIKSKPALIPYGMIFRELDKLLAPFTRA